MKMFETETAKVQLSRHIKATEQQLQEQPFCNK